MLFDIGRWTTQKQHIQKLRVAELQMLRWMYGQTRNERIRNEYRETIEVAPRGKKLRVNRLK